MASPADALDRFGAVPENTKRDLERHVALLAEWQRVHNLVSRSALDDVWTRHVADSLQLLGHAPDFREWVDLGSGAGFPGLVVAIACKHASDPLPIGERMSPKATDEGGGSDTWPLTQPPLRSADRSPEGRGILQPPHFTLVESNAKKAAFLRAAIRETRANATVANERIETHALKMAGRADVISARALAPLSELLGLAAPYAHKNTVMLFPKGKEHVQERHAAAQSWSFDVIDFPSATDSGGRVLAIRNLSPKARP